MDTSRWFDLHQTGEKHRRRGSCPMVVGDMRTHEERSILIGGLSLTEIVDCAVGHESHGLAQSNGTKAIDLHQMAQMKGNRGPRRGPQSIWFCMINGSPFIIKWTAHIARGNPFIKK